MRKSFWLHPIALIFYCSAAVASYMIQDGAVTTAKIAANAVTTAKLGIAGGSVSATGYPFSSDANTGLYSAGADTLGLVTAGTARLNIDGSGNFTAPESGGATALPAFFARAYVCVNGNTAADLSGTYSRTGTTVSVAVTAHGLSSGQTQFFDFTTGSATDVAAAIVTVTDANNFTFTHPASGSTSGNVTMKRYTFSGGNIAFVSASGTAAVGTADTLTTGIFLVNFTTPMPDANYGLSGLSAVTSGRFTALICGSISETDSQCAKNIKYVKFGAFNGSGATAGTMTPMCITIFR